jgi:hypothetical protein
MLLRAVTHCSSPPPVIMIHQPFCPLCWPSAACSPLPFANVELIYLLSDASSVAVGWLFVWLTEGQYSI